MVKNLQDLKTAINTFIAVSDTESVSKAFEDAKKKLISEFESAKDEIGKLSEGNISIKVETHNDGIKVEVLEISKLEKSKKTKYIISFEDDTRAINLKVAEFEERSRGNEEFLHSSKDYDIPKKTFIQGYDSKINEFCFLEGNNIVDVFESVIEKVAKDLLDMIKNKSKGNITII